MKKKKITVITLVFTLIFSLILPIKFVYAADTGLKSPTATGEDYNQWSTPTNAYISNNTYATETTVNQKQDYYNFSFGVPGNTSIDGIEVKLEAKYSGGFSGSAIIGAELSWNGGTSYTATGYDTGALTASDVIYTLGGATDTWGRTWSDTEFSNTNFRLYVNADSVRSLGGQNLLDHVQVKVYYTILNQAPTAPTSLWTEGQTNPTGVTDTTPEFSAIYNDPDSGDIANKYRIQVDDDAGFGSTIWDSGAAGTTMTNCTQGTRCQDISYGGSALSWGTKYYWRIKYWDDSGAEGAWSTESAYFTMNKVPNTPTLNSPSSGATDQSLTPALKTTATDDDSDYLRYKIELDTVNTFNSDNLQTFNQTVSQTGWSGQDAEAGTAYASGTQATYTLQSSLSVGTIYYWRSYAIDPGGTNTWSSTQATVYSFTTNFTPIAPTNFLTEGKTNPTEVTDLTPEFSAIYRDPDSADVADYYRVQVDDDSGFSSILWDSGKTSMTNCTEGNRCQDISYAGSSLSWGTTYYVRIKFWDDGGLEGAWSTERAFFIMSLINRPLVCLIDDSSHPDQLTIKWQDKTTLETGYRIEKSVDGGAFGYLTDKAADSTSHLDTDTSADHTYQYRIRAESNNGNSTWCTTATVDLAVGDITISGVTVSGITIK